MTTAEYLVTGMTCEHCTNAVSNELKTLTGVTDVHIDLASGQVTVASSAPLERNAVAAAVDEAGYQLANTPPGTA
ncbi:MAG: heavy-metal-associated domain-containing protein [Actinomycetota bacterium]|nr:heavy-metal-associated domain-containing protein [Actinomycetota bacterium]